MSFSVIVPACNEEDYLNKTLVSIEAARAFASEQEIEVVVVDNASTYRTALIATAAAAVLLRFPGSMSSGRIPRRTHQAESTERVLFPGLDGLSQWLKRYFTTPKERCTAAEPSRP